VGVSCDWCFAQIYSSLAPPPPRGDPISWYRCWQCTPPPSHLFFLLLDK
jgi:hypothetical protein